MMIIDVELFVLTFSYGSDPLAALFIRGRDEIKRECRQCTVTSCYAIQF